KRSITGWKPPPARQGNPLLNHVGFKRREAVEADSRIGRRIGARSLDQHLTADLETDRQQIRLPFVKNIDRVAGRPGDDARLPFVIVERRAYWIADHLVHRFGQSVELADVEIDPLQL